MSETEKKTDSKRVVSFSDLYRSVISHRWAVLVTFLVVLLSTVAFTFSQQMIYQATATLRIDLPSEDTLRKLSGQSGEKPLVLSDIKKYYKTQYAIIQSSSLAGKVVDRVKNIYGAGSKHAVKSDKLAAKQLTKQLTVKSFLENLKVKPVSESLLVQISYIGEDAKYVATVANETAQIYIDQNRENSLAVIWKLLDEERNKIANLKANRLKCEDELNTFLSQNSDFNIGITQRISIVQKKSDQLGEEIANMEASLIKLRSAANSAKEALAFSDAKKIIEVFPDLSAYPNMQQLLSKIESLTLKQQELRAAKENHPDLPGVIYLLEKNKRKVRRELGAISYRLQNEARGIERSYNEITLQLSKTSKLLRHLMELELGHQKLVKLKEITENELAKSTLKFKTLESSSRIYINNVSVLDTAKTPDSAIKPKVTQNLAIGFLAGLLLGLVLAFLLESTSKTIRTSDDVEKFLNCTSLGIFPKINDEDLNAQFSKNAAEMFTYTNPTSANAECIRQIRTNIRYMFSSYKLSRILITSPSPSEGKTTVAANLATALALAGRPVLVVDLDLRKPRLHEAFGLDNKIGLTDFLAGDAKLKEVIRESGVENLHVLSCGRIPDNPAEVVDSDKVEVMLKSLGHTFYKWIIIDSPPVAAAADTLALSRFADGSIIVCKSRATSIEMALSSISQLEKVQSKVLGVVVNYLDLDDKTLNISDRNYYHHYGYYYGEKVQDKAASTNSKEKAKLPAIVATKQKPEVEQKVAVMQKPETETKQEVKPETKQEPKPNKQIETSKKTEIADKTKLAANVEAKKKAVENKPEEPEKASKKNKGRKKKKRKGKKRGKK